jgi:hypothetical protein
VTIARILRLHLAATLCALVVLAAAAAPLRAASLETIPAILDSVQYSGFRYFWYEANPANGLIKDRSTPGSPCSIAANGFGLSAICIGIDHGWVTRSAGAARVLTTLQTFWNGPQGSATSGTMGYHGLFYHFLDMNTGLRFQPTVWHPELSTIDTALLLAGVLDAEQYFTGADATETQIRALADAIYRRVDWTFVRTCPPNCTPTIWMGWKPETGFSGFGAWFGYNEAMIMYLLAIGSPTFSIPGGSWSNWTAGYNWGTQYGYNYLLFAPLFGHQYSHCWVDYRAVNDTLMTRKGITYFENSRRATLAQQAYCIANPGGQTGYSATLWGITACDDPAGYAAHGAPPPQSENGTLAPTAAISSLPFAPEIVLPTIQNLYDNYKPQLWGAYGFRDAFNLRLNWVDAAWLGIDQGPIVIMIENYRNGSVWNRFMQNPYIQAGLAGAGFTPVTTGVPSAPVSAIELSPAQPNPFVTEATLNYRLPERARVTIRVFDVSGRSVGNLLDTDQDPGPHAVRIDGRPLPSGVYRCVIRAGEATASWTLVHVR